VSILSVVTARGQTFNKLSLSWDVEPRCRALWTKWASSRCLSCMDGSREFSGGSTTGLSATGAWTEGVGHVTVSPGPANVAAKVKAGPTEMPRVTAPSHHLITLLGFSRGRDS
jgi:hypothetical protein